MKPDVVAAVILKEGRVLLGKRSPSKRKAAGFWCPISGKVEKGESFQEAVEREVFEEVGLKVKALRPIKSFPTHDQAFMIHWWLVDVKEGTPYLKNDEHSEVAFFTPDELKSLEPSFPEDIELFLEILSH